MQVKVVQIDKKREPYSPQGKKYTIYCFETWVERDGVREQALVKAFYDFTLSVGQVIEGERSVYRDAPEYMLPKKSSGGNGGYGRKPFIPFTLEEIDALRNHFTKAIIKEAKENGIDINTQHGLAYLQATVNTCMMAAEHTGAKVGGGNGSPQTIIPDEVWNGGTGRAQDIPSVINTALTEAEAAGMSSQMAQNFRNEALAHKTDQAYLDGMPQRIKAAADRATREAGTF